VTPFLDRHIWTAGIQLNNIFNFKFCASLVSNQLDMLATVAGICSKHPYLEWRCRLCLTVVRNALIEKFEAITVHGPHVCEHCGSGFYGVVERCPMCGADIRARA
jgi:hypothetical protein